MWVRKASCLQLSQVYNNEKVQQGYIMTTAYKVWYFLTQIMSLALSSVSVYVRLLWRCALWLNDTSYVWISEYEVPQRNTILEHLPLLWDWCRWLNIELTTWLSNNIRFDVEVRERKPIRVLITARQHSLLCRLQSAVLAIVNPSLCPSVRPSVRHTLALRPMTLVSGNIRYMRILAGVPLGGDLKWEWGCCGRQFLAIWVATSSETSEIRPAILYDDILHLVGLWLIAKWMT